MRALLVTLTVLEVVALVGALAVYLVLIARSLRQSAMTLAKVTFGVRAIEAQTAKVGHALGAVNGRLTDIAAGLRDLAGLADGPTGQRR